MTVVVGGMTVEDVLVSPFGEDLYRLEEEPCFFLGAEDDEDIESFPCYGDVMRAEEVGPKTLRYLSLHSRGPYKHFSFTLARRLVESDDFSSALEQVVKEGGHWERHTGGVLFIAIPLSSNLDPHQLLTGLDGEA